MAILRIEFFLCETDTVTAFTWIMHTYNVSIITYTAVYMLQFFLLEFYFTIAIIFLIATISLCSWLQCTKMAIFFMVKLSNKFTESTVFEKRQWKKIIQSTARQEKSNFVNMADRVHLRNKCEISPIRYAKCTCVARTHMGRFRVWVTFHGGCEYKTLL